MKWPSGVKRTKQRERVLSAMERAPSPMSAMEIYTLAGKGEPALSLSTVYRILELFEQRGIVVKTTLMDGGKAIYELNGHRHKHYAVCLKCKKMLEVESCPMAEAVPGFVGGDFEVLGHKLELYGYCGECRDKD